MRIGFILGNLTSRHDEARINFMKEKRSLEILISTLKMYFDLDQVSNSKILKY